MINTDEFQTLFADHLQSFELSLARHEARMAAINADLEQRMAATLARLDLELDALAEQARRSR